jgi:hypothetical protein
MKATDGKLGALTNFFIKHAVAIFLVATVVCLVLVASLTNAFKPNVVGVWLVVGILTSLLFSGVALVVVLAVAAVDKARHLRLITYEAKPDVRLRDRFAEEKIGIAEFYSPLLVPNNAMRFERCELSGPGSLFLDASDDLDGSVLQLCDLIVVKPGEKPQTAAVFTNATFRDCRFVNLVVYMTQDAATAWLAGQGGAAGGMFVAGNLEG